MTPRSLVVGGTGPTGPAVVEGLLARGHDVTVLHTGRHEVAFSREIEHIHTDPNDADELAGALGRRSFDLAVCMYGRLRVVADAMRGRVEQVIAVGGVFYPGWVDGRGLTATPDGAAAPPLHSPSFAPVVESTPQEAAGAFSAKAVEAERALMEWHHRGDFRATLLRYPMVYGPRQLAPAEWSVVRRLLDGRSVLLVPDGGLVFETRLYSENASLMILSAVDRPDRAAGEVFNCGDAEPMTLRDWASMIAEALGRELELVSIPFEAAGITSPYSRGPWNVCHRVLDVRKAVTLLGYEPIPAHAGLVRTARWYAEHPLERGGPEEAQLGDAFDYGAEDQLLSLARRFVADATESVGSGQAYRHPYAHPTPRTST